VEEVQHRQKEVERRKNRKKVRSDFYPFGEKSQSSKENRALGSGIDPNTVQYEGLTL
jgi:hypothetical protein